MARKTYRTKRLALSAAHGKEVYRVKGPPRGWRISAGAKVRGERGRALRRRKKSRKRKSRKKARSNVGKVFRLKKWAVKFAKGRPVKKVPGGYKICKKGNPNPAECGFE